jgi:hypothetical protein
MKKNEIAPRFVLSGNLQDALACTLRPQQSTLVGKCIEGP